MYLSALHESPNCIGLRRTKSILQGVQNLDLAEHYLRDMGSSRPLKPYDLVSWTFGATWHAGSKYPLTQDYYENNFLRIICCNFSVNVATSKSAGTERLAMNAIAGPCIIAAAALFQSYLMGLCQTGHSEKQLLWRHRELWEQCRLQPLLSAMQL